MINKSKKLKFLQSREQWKTTNSNKEDNWSEMIQNLENEEGVCLSQFFFNKPKSQTPSYCYISEFFFQSFNTPCAKLLVYLRVFSISQYTMRQGTEREKVRFTLYFGWYFDIAPPALPVCINK